MYYRTTFAALIVVVALIAAVPAFAGVTTVNGLYEGEEIYYIEGGIEEGVTERVKTSSTLSVNLDYIRQT